MSMVDLIKKMSEQAQGAQNPVALLYGTVSKASPIEIEIHQKLILTKDFLSMTKTAADENLIKGDKVALIRMQGGQQFLVIDKVV